ncbi:MAG: FtsX-like permease family protein [Patescibacteria group bacterium]|jgi:putative ABC transport system permease protein
MFNEIFRNMWRKKLRSMLTIFGISIGILAFTVMGSLALRFNKMIQGGKKYVTGQITLAPKGTNFGMGGAGGTLPVDTLNKISKVDGVEAVAAGIEMPMEEPNLDQATVSMGPAPTIEGMDLSSKFKNRNWETLAMKEGRMIEASDPVNSVTIGYTISTDKGLKTGDAMKIRGQDFKVLGIVDKTMTGPDTYIFMPLSVARDLYIESNPFLKSLKEQAANAQEISDSALAKLPAETRAQIEQARTFKVEDISTGAAVSWKDGYDSDQVAQRIKDQFKDEVIVMSPKALGEMIDKASAVFNSVILGSAILALIVGGFSIINTMVMSITERTKEIGIKKAIGASSRSIAREYTIEAGIIGLIGGLIGIGLGSLMIVIINNAVANKSGAIFELSPVFLAIVLAFSFGLGMTAGLLPAWRASKLRVVEALRQL